MKYMEEKLPTDEFIRVHRSFIVRLDCINAIGRSSVMVEQKDLPIGDAYRDRMKHYVSRLAVL
jgi:DNA-binding LytR/AlgR family response regulator